MAIAETEVFEVGIPADALDEIANFVSYLLAHGHYVPYVLVNLVNAFFPPDVEEKDTDTEAYDETVGRLNRAKDGVHYGFPEDGEVPN